MLTDQISDLLTRLRNAYMRGIPSIEVTYTKMNQSILETLKENNFINEIKVFKHENSKIKGINVSLKYDEETQPAISHISRVSKPGLRSYIKSDEIRSIMGGLGIFIISTSRGVISSKEAKKRKLGGEIICKVY